MPLTKDQILAMLPSLSHDDLKAIRAAIGGLLPEAISTPRAMPEGPSRWLAEAIATQLGGHPRFTGVAAKAFDKNSPVFIDFLHQYFSKSLENKVTGCALIRYLLLLLIDDLKDMKVPVTRNTVTMNLHRIRDVFNDCFPGYGEAQAAYIITRLAAVK